MVDEKQVVIKKFIYVPRVGEPFHGEPYVIYAVSISVDSVRGSRSMKEIEKGRSKVFSINRCMPYNGANLTLCKQHIDKRNKLENEYREFEKIARRKKQP